MQLTQKETSLLKDLKDQEKLCVDKYGKHATAATDPQLKTLFSQIASVEQGHYDTLCKIESGTVPPALGAQKPAPAFSEKYGQAPTPEKQGDCYLCTDLLATEKHASALYDTCIFEFSDANLRTTLANIQREEQQHGKMIYDYMAKNAMYS